MNALGRDKHIFPLQREWSLVAQSGNSLTHKTPAIWLDERAIDPVIVRSAPDLYITAGASNQPHMHASLAEGEIKNFGIR